MAVNNIIKRIQNIIVKTQVSMVTHKELNK